MKKREGLKINPSVHGPPPPLMALPLLLFLLFSLPGLVNAADPVWSRCDSTTNYTADSPFAANLGRALTFLNDSTAPTGFNATTTGGGTNQATALALCRGDIGSSDCQSCVSDAVVAIRQRCPNQTEAQVWFKNCLLHYSNVYFLFKFDSTPQFYYWITRNVTDPATFNSRLGLLMQNLSDEAATANSRFAAGNTRVSDFGSVYGLVECTRDLSAEDCKVCLVRVVGDIERCCSGKQFGFIGAPSCTIRFSSDPFYNFTAMTEVSTTATAEQPPAVGSPEISPAPESVGGSGRKELKVGISVGVVVVGVFVGFCSWAAVVVVKRKKGKGRGKRERGVAEEETENGDEGSFLFELKSLEVATNRFSGSNRLGEGGFGPVYKGKLLDGREIAVKKLSVRSSQGVQEFSNEVKLLLKLQHKNLVILLGCCIQGGENMLVYEYLPNKSLDKILFDKSISAVLDWSKRLNIIVGIARGLMYLHEESQLRIIHRDIKASNILLDEHMNPKISDFGLARLFGDESHVNTRMIAGTFGYMAPEYTRHGLLSVKCDVFSFGVLVLEIVSGRKNYNDQLDQEKQELIHYAWRLRREAKLMDLVDINLGSCPENEVLKCIEIALLCCEASVENRPTMASIVLMLSNNSTTIPQLQSPGYGYRSSINTRKSSKSSTSVSPRRSKDSRNQISNNFISISNFDGR